MSDDDDLMHIDDLAQYMHCTTEALRKRLARHPDDLPLPFKVGSRLVWRRSTVVRFFERRDRAVRRRAELIRAAHEQADEVREVRAQAQGE